MKTEHNIADHLLSQIAVLHEQLLNYGEKQLFVPFKMDYFAVSLPDLLIFEDDLQKRHEQYCHYLIGLGHLGLGNTLKATNEFKYILKHDKYHVGAHIHLNISNIISNMD